MKQFPAAPYWNFSNGSKQFSQHPKSPDKLRRQINPVRIPEEPVNYLHYFVQTSFGSPVKILALSLPINRLELEARQYLLQKFPCDEFYLHTLTCLHNTLYSKTCLKRKAIVPVFFFRFHGFPSYKGLCFNKTKYKKIWSLRITMKEKFKIKVCK